MDATVEHTERRKGCHVPDVRIHGGSGYLNVDGFASALEPHARHYYVNTSIPTFVKMQPGIGVCQSQAVILAVHC